MKSAVITLVLACGFPAGELYAQLAIEQRVLDFQNLAGTYAKRYAPYEWKRQAFGFDLYDVKPWLERIRSAKTDLEFFEICHEYVANLNDTHSHFSTPSSFTADLGLIVDIYDGKLLIEYVNRTMLPISAFPFQIGDEILSVDAKSVEEWITEFSRFYRYGNPQSTRRLAADRITYRVQSTYPRATEVGDSAVVVIRRQNGDEQSYRLPWSKAGYPMTQVGPVPTPGVSARKARLVAAEDEPDYMKPLNELRNWKFQDDGAQRRTWTPSPEDGDGNWYLGSGGKSPVFSGGFPSSFVQRLGRLASEFHYSGTYTSGDLKIGYLRIPSFSPPSLSAAVQELEKEIDFLEKNTDGLVVDVMRNPGGGCYMLDLAAHLNQYPFYFFGEEIRVTRSQLQSMKFALDAAKRAKAEQWIIDLYSFYLGQLETAYTENRGRTGTVPACTQFGQVGPPLLDNQPAKVVYTKPLIVLIDEFSVSAADIFPSMMQDNLRGPLVGMRSSGGGGSVSNWPVGVYSEATATNTNTLVVRKGPISSPQYPTAPYVENIGAIPDIELPYMTKENLLNRGRPFVDAFTKILADQIQGKK
jgi:hypothetical protein